jgi:hypothetical protein
MKRPVKARDTSFDAEDLEKRLRHRQFSWCRLWNGFLDDPLLRVVAAMTALPLYQVQAFVTRLDVLANKSTPRGYVGDFKATEFAAAQGMSAEDAARLFNALEHPDIGWIEQDTLTGFWNRNRDEEDRTGPERDRRRKARNWVKKLIARQIAAGAIAVADATKYEILVWDLPDAALFRLKEKLLDGESFIVALSTCHGVAAVAPRGAATEATARADQPTSTQTFLTVANTVDSPSGESQGHQGAEVPADSSDPQAEATAWLSSTGCRIVTETMNETPARAATLIERWGRDLDDPPALRAIIEAAVARGVKTSTFAVMVSDQVRRQVSARLQGVPLPLPPVLATSRDGAPAAGPRAPQALPLTGDGDSLRPTGTDN